MMGFHQPFKSTAKEKLLREKVNADNSVLHLIGAYCTCSVKVVNHLVKRSPLNSISEKVIIIGENKDLLQQLKKGGYVVEELSSEVAYKNYSINVLPQMIIYEKNNIKYSGGYSKKRSPASETDFEDVAIINNSFKNTKSEALPIFGCANGENNKKQMDPLKLKYQD
ncbi:hypothetical protein DOM21_03925 [Bacteriovorax stolpii]|uniref:Uncharacterized protein n=2 Tax=Bacteriovorax stolpii TaxID=960 RepID=A0A2K9NV72_BACTC|nr:hypothetical protein C0V70_15085 [Bacteriovorax stolpii]QDK40615.1 hypothetical protein DOM21_03925 [Bacteriovorax stolpii]